MGIENIPITRMAQADETTLTATGTILSIKNNGVDTAQIKNNAVGTTQLSTTVQAAILTAKDELTGGITALSPTNITGYRGQAYTPAINITFNSATKNAACTASTCLVYTTGGTLVSSVAFSGNVATFTGVKLQAGIKYYIVAYNGGSQYTMPYQNTFTTPIICRYGTYGGAAENDGSWVENTTRWCVITSINVSLVA